MLYAPAMHRPRYRNRISYAILSGLFFVGCDGQATSNAPGQAPIEAVPVADTAPQAPEAPEAGGESSPTATKPTPFSPDPVIQSIWENGSKDSRCKHNAYG